jgi:predicted nuclease of restriction endonuclease-like RecB superfamily
MLTRELAIAHRENGRIIPDRLTTAAHAIYPELARRMIAVYESGIRKTRQELHRSIVQVLEEDRDCPIRRMNAFCKLLDEYGRFDRGKPKQAADLRRRVFAIAAQHHPMIAEPESILDHSESAAKQSIARQLGMDWPELRQRLYEDLIENNRLSAFETPQDPIDLLSRYNVAQTQAALLDATSVRIEATTDWKLILRYAKLAGLMHSISETKNGYRIELDGPSSVLRHTHRYGASIANFLPGLLSCQGWEMIATMRCPRKGSSNRGYPAGPILELNDRSGLRSPVARHASVDSEIERTWMEAWETESHAPWSLVREGEILVRGQRVFIPDFVFIRDPSANREPSCHDRTVHRQAGRVLLEIAGFWTPQYIHHRSESLTLFSDIPILVAIPRQTARAWDGVPWSPAHRKILFGRHLKPKDVLPILEELAPNP